MRDVIYGRIPITNQLQINFFSIAMGTSDVTRQEKCARRDEKEQIEKPLASFGRILNVKMKPF